MKDGSSSRKSLLGRWIWWSAIKMFFWSTKRKKVHFAKVMDICDLQNAELKRKHQKYKGRVVFRGDTVKGDSGSYVAFAKSRLVCVANDGRKGDGRHSEITRMCWTSRRRSICIHLGKMDDTHLPDYCGKDSSKKVSVGLFIENKQGLFLSVYVDDIKMTPISKKQNNKRWSWWSHLNSWSRMLELHSTRMQTEWHHYWRVMQPGLDEKWWADSSECCCYLQNVHDLLTGSENTLWTAIWKTICRPGHSVWCNGRISSSYCEGPVKTPIWLESFTWHIPRICIVRGEEFGKETSRSQTLRRWKIWRCQKSMLGDQVFRKSTSVQDHFARVEEHNDDLQGELYGSQPWDKPTDDREARNDFWSIEGNYIYRHHVEPRFQLIPNTNAIHWWGQDNIGTMDPFHAVHTINEKPYDGYVWSGERLTKIQATTRPDHLWPETWSSVSTAAQKKRTTAMGNRPRVGNARQFKGIHSVEPGW